MRNLVLPLILLTLVSCQQAEESDTRVVPPAATSTPRTPEEIKAGKDAMLADHLKVYARDAMRPLRYVAVEPTENNPRLLTFVYLMGPHYCGSGGCTLLVLSPLDAGGYRLLGKIPITRPPVMMLDTTTDGMPDLAVGVSGGGAASRQAVLRYDDDVARYPGNPTVPPAEPAAGPLTGQTIISQEMLEMTAIDLPK